MPLTSIGKDCSVSPATVQREINEVASSLQRYQSKLPEHLSFDEFKFAKGKMAFEYINVLTGEEILDILHQCTQFVIKNHFITNYRLPTESRLRP